MNKSIINELLDALDAHDTLTSRIAKRKDSRLDCSLLIAERDKVRMQLKAVRARLRSPTNDERDAITYAGMLIKEHCFKHQAAIFALMTPDWSKK